MAPRGREGVGARLIVWLDENRWRAPFVVCVAIAMHLAWLVIFGRFTHIDEIGYKGPGLSLVTHGVFAISEYRGLNSSFAGAIPGHNGCFAVYPGLFAGWVTLWGFSKLSCILFDGVVHGALVLVSYGIARLLFREVPRFFALASAVLLLPLGASGRADDLACVFALAGLSLLLQRPSRWFWDMLAGVSFAVGFMTHPQSAFLVSPLYAVTLACSEDRIRTASRLRGAAWVALGSGSALVAGFFPAWLLHPDLVQQFKTASAHYVGAQQIGGSGIAFAWRFGKFEMLIALGLACSGFFDLVPLRRDPRRWCQLWLGPIASVAMVLLLMPVRYFYYWFAVPWLVVVSVGRLAERFREPGVTESKASRTIHALLAACGVAAGVVSGLRSGLIQATLPQGQSFDANVRIIRELVPVGTRVVTIEFWPALAADHQVFHSEFSSLTDDDVDYIILTGNGSGAPGEAQGWPAGVHHESFELIHDNLNRSRATWLGVPISRSGYGFGTMIYRRKSTLPATTAADELWPAARPETAAPQ